MRDFNLNLQKKQRISGSYRAAVDGGSDVRVVIVRHFLIVGAQESDGFIIIVQILVVPSH